MSNIVPLATLPVDQGEIARYVDAVFRHADPGTLVMFRAFTQEKPWKVASWQAVPIGGPVAPEGLSQSFSAHDL